MTDLGPSRRRRGTALLLFAALLLLYNSNGREIGSIDTQPTKYAARELARAGTLRLDAVIAEHPGLGDRPGFANDRSGHRRSAYSIVPALIAAGPAFALRATGALDLDGPLAANVIAVVTASLLTAAAVTLMFAMLLRLAAPRIAWLSALALGAGTNYWAVVSRTLWQHETVAFGIALVLWTTVRPAARLRPADLWLAGVGLALAGSARPQVAPMVLVLLIWIGWREGARALVVPAVVLGATTAAVVATNEIWFGSIAGGFTQLEAAALAIHHTTGSLSATPWIGAAGLLVSPSRGLLIFSPVVLVSAVGARDAWRANRDCRWILSAGLVQFAVYSFYAVWWGGHTFGPRYTIDLLPTLVPAGAFGAMRLARARWTSAIGVTLLGWSVAVAALGAFVYPNEAWNTKPADVDVNHDRLWNVRDSQIVRAVTSPSSPQNFALFTTAAFRKP